MLNIECAVNDRIGLELDDLIFRLQPFGGISEYWKRLYEIAKHDPNLNIVKTLNRSRYLGIKSNADIFHSSYFRFSRSRGVRNVVTCYDMAYELGYVSNSINSKLIIHQRKRAYDHADAIICISHNTKCDLLKVYPYLRDRVPIKVIHLGVESLSSEISTEPISSKFIKYKYVLYVGSRGYYKNFKNAVLGFMQSQLSKEGFNLICTGEVFNKAEVEFIKSLNLEQKIISVGLISKLEMISLYQNAFCLLYPSLFEGFGLPILEAMKNGCPVIASKGSSITEVVESSGILVDGLCIDSISTALNKLQIKCIRDSYIQLGLDRILKFTWGSTVDEHINLYLSLK